MPNAVQTAPGPPMPETLIPSQRARRDRIVNAALELLKVGEYDKIQMRDIAEEAGVALGTVYRYFASKEHLFAAVLVEWSQSLEEHMEQRPLTGEGAAEQLGDLCRRVIGAFDRLPQYFRLMTTIETSRDPNARRCYQQFVASTQRAFGQPLEVYEPDDREQLLEVVMMVLGGVTRAWALGLLSTDEANARLERAIHVVFSPPPTTITP